MAGVRARTLLALACASATGAQATPFTFVPGLPLEWASGTRLPAPPGMALLERGTHWGVSAARNDADIGAASMSAAVALDLEGGRAAASVGQFGVSFYREQRASIAAGGGGLALLAEVRRVHIEGTPARTGAGWGARIRGRAAGFVAALDLLPRHVLGEPRLFGTDWEAHVVVPAGAAALGASARTGAGRVRVEVRLAWIEEPASLGFALSPGDGTITLALRLVARDLTALAGVTWQPLLGGRRWAALAGGSP